MNDFYFVFGFHRSRSRSWSPGRQEPPIDRRIMRIESPSGELLRMKEVIPDEPMSPDEEQGIVQRRYHISGL